MRGDTHETSAEPDSSAHPRFCRGAWRQHVIVLLVSAAAVLALALRLNMDGAPTSGTGDLWASLVAGRGARAGGEAARPAVAVGAAPADDVLGSSARPVAATVRASFNDAARNVRPSTLSVRASYGTDASGQIIERVGSAVVVDAAGYAVTCSHVVAGASAIGVRRFREPDRWLSARALASDGDLALLQIEGDAPLPAAALGDSSRIGVGDWVLAMGHPFQLGLTVTAGIISRRDATLTFPGGKLQTGLLQTDAAINEGSSGGPLVNVAGEVVGINAAIYAPTGVFSGAGFAIPSNRVRQFVSSVLGVAQRAAPAAPASWGLGLVSLTPALATELSYPGPGGVVVSSVAPYSAAEQARLAKGDVITAIAGQPVRDLSSAMAIRERLGSNAAVSLEVWRLGVVQTVTLRPRAG